MTIFSQGFHPQEDTSKREQQLFCDNLSLLLMHEANILHSADQFFCQPSFAWCSYPYVSGDGALFLGYLLLGWKNGILREPCPICTDEFLITNFGGSVLSGNNWCYGFCVKCNSFHRSTSASKTFVQRVLFTQQLRKHAPERLQDWETYEGETFTFGLSGLQHSQKKRLTCKTLAQPVELETLIQELKSGTMRKADPVNVSTLLTKELPFKFGKPL